MRKFIAYVLSLVVAALPVGAQSISIPFKLNPGESAAKSVTDDTAPAIYCIYVGTSGSGFVTVAAGGDITFESPDSSTADTTFECPVSGGLGGIIDVSDAACDTVGELLDIVNTSTSNFRCAAHAALRTDSTNDTFLAASDQSANRPAGYGILFDTDTFLKQRAVLDQSTFIAPAYRSGRYFTGAGVLQQRPWTNWQSFLIAAQATSTYGSGTSNLYVYAVDQLQGLVSTGATETVTTLWGPAAGGATTVAKMFGGCDTPATACDTAWGYFGLACPLGQKCVVSLENSAAMATTTLNVNGAISTR